MTGPVLHIFKITGIAGSEKHLLLLLQGLREQGFDARFLLLEEPGNPVDSFMSAASARGIPGNRMVIRGNADPALLFHLWGYMRRARPAVVHTHLLHADLYGIPAARLAGVPVVITSRHNDDDFRYRVPYPQINWLLWRMVDSGIAISAAIARFAVKVEGAPPDKVHIIRYGLEPSERVADSAAARAALRAELGLPPDALLIGLVCRLVEQKGLPYALRAFQQIAGDFSAADLVIAGDGPLRSDLEREASALGVGDRVHFLGWRADTAPVFAALDVFLMPSLWEGFGLVLLEAMAQAIPVVGSEVSAIPEVVVDGETGRLCPPRDVDALAMALGELLSDAALRERWGEAGRTRLEGVFSPARMVAETVALYRRLADPTR